MCTSEVFTFAPLITTVSSPSGPPCPPYDTLRTEQSLFVCVMIGSTRAWCLGVVNVGRMQSSPLRSPRRRQPLEFGTSHVNALIGTPSY